MGGKEQETIILIVDDEEGIRRLFKDALEEEGYLCLLAGSGQEALDLVASHLVDMALIDIIMPGMSGIDLAQRLQASHPDMGIMFVTAMAQIQLAVDAMKSGAYDYITKPIPFDRLKERVQQALERRQARQEDRQLQAQLQQDMDLKADEVGKRVREIAALNQKFQAYILQQFDVADIARRVAQIADRTSEELRKLGEEANKIAQASTSKSN